MLSLDEIQNLFGSLWASHWRRKPSRLRGSHVESLEVRALLATFVVTNLNDAGTGSLRDAIAQANVAPGVDEINFTTTGTILLSSGQMTISDSVDITGPGSGSLSINGNRTGSRILLISNADASLINVSISGVTVRNAGNGTTNISGGAINNAENLKLTDVSFVSNDVGPVGHSGAIAHSDGTLTVSDCTFSNNRAGASGGGAIRVFSGTANVSRSTFSGNQTEGNGGAIYVTGGTVEIRQSTISGNTAGRNGATGFGGGVSHDAGTMTIRHSTISGNTAYSGGGIINYSSAGMLIENTTISGNNETGFSGGGIFNNGPLTIRNSTLTNNTSDHGGGVFSRGITPEQLIIQNSIIAENKRPDGIPTDLRGTTPTISHSLVGVNTDTALTPSATPNTNGNLIGSSTPINPNLGPLSLNGGPTKTHALLTGSPAINRGDNKLLNGLTADQRGNPLPRIADTTVDMGAYELFSVSNPIVVSTIRDELDTNISPGDLSLREAILLANSSPGVNVITFAFSGQLALTAGQMTISDSVDITGPGSGSLSISGVGTGNRILLIDNADASLINVSISGVTVRDAGNGTTNISGGAINNAENLKLTDVSFVSNDVGPVGHSGAIAHASGALTVSGCTFSNNQAGAAGGAILIISGTANISGSTFSGNQTERGGGAIYVFGGTVEIRQSTISSNTAGRNGVRGFGGGIFNYEGTITMHDSIVSGNIATGGSGFGGGGIFSYTGSVTISQSTVSGNATTEVDAHGGGIFSHTGSVMISQSTVTLNEAKQGHGGGFFSNSSPVSIRNSILAGNIDNGTASDVRQSPDGDDTFTVTNSLIGRNNGTGLTPSATPDSNGNLIGGENAETALNPRLGPLANNGGPTLTHALLNNSPALNRGRNALAEDVTLPGNPALQTDQRGAGFSRAQFGIVDMGALESSVMDSPEGTTGDDAFTLAYSSTTTTGTVTVTVSTDGGPDVNVGTFPMNLPMTIDGLGGTDSVRIVGTSGADTFDVNSSNGLTVNGASLMLEGIESRTLEGAAEGDVYRFDADSVLGLWTLNEDGGGIDTIDLSPTTAIRLSLDLSNAFFQSVHPANLSLILSSGITIENAIGGSGADTLIGNNLANTLTGGDGNDQLIGGVGSDVLSGGLHDDLYRFAKAFAAEADQVIEESDQGTDTLDFSTLATAVNVNLGTSSPQTIHTNRTLSLNSDRSFENIIGGMGADTLFGNLLNNRLSGGDGKDQLIGGAGNDILLGGLKDDIYRFETALAREADQVIEAANQGVDTLDFSTLTTPVNVNLGALASRTIHSNRTLTLNSGSTFENVIGGAANDTLIGNVLRNQLTGGPGDDQLTGGPGSDVLSGGLHNDNYRFGNPLAAEADQVIELANQGSDTLDFSSVTSPVSISLGTTVPRAVHTNRTLRLNSSSTLENIVGGAANDTLIGNSLNNRLIGGNGHNVLVGADGADTLIGGTGRDILIGGRGLETVNGGSNDDILIAGRMKDDTSFAYLNALRTQWISTSPYATRVARLRAGVGSPAVSLKAGINVLRDAGEDDVLTGGTGVDWYFRAVDDAITDLFAGETIDVL